MPLNNRTFDSGQHVVLAGHFDPATIGPLIGGKGGTALSRMSGPPGVPIHNLAIELANQGIQTTLMGGLDHANELYVQSFPISAVVYPKRGRVAWVVDGLRRERTLISKYLRQIHPSLVHAHWTLEGARAIADWDGPKVLTVHDAALECAKIRWGWKWSPLAHASTARWLINTSAVLKRFNHIIAVSPFVETYLRLRHGFRGEIRVIPNAIPPLHESIRVIDAFPKTDRITFGCDGSPGRLKNIQSAISAFVGVHQELPKSRLLVYGNGWERVASQYAHLPIEFRGFLKHSVFLEELASQIDIWVHPSRIEAHPISICEAIQVGCPVIAGAASGGVAWTLNYGRAGLLVDIESPSEIAQAMLGLARNRALGQRLVRYGRRMILDRWNIERITQMHLDFYQELIAKRTVSCNSTQG